MIQNGNARLIRSVKISGGVPANAWYRIATAGKIENKDGVIHCTEGVSAFRIKADGATLAGKNLVIPAKAGTMTISYQWAQ